MRRLRNKVNGYRLLANDVIVAEVESRIWDLTDELDYQAELSSKGNDQRTSGNFSKIADLSARSPDQAGRHVRATGRLGPYRDCAISIS